MIKKRSFSSQKCLIFLLKWFILNQCVTECFKNSDESRNKSTTIRIWSEVIKISTVYYGTILPILITFTIRPKQKLLYLFLIIARHFSRKLSDIFNHFAFRIRKVKMKSIFVLLVVCVSILVAADDEQAIRDLCRFRVGTFPHPNPELCYQYVQCQVYFW